MRGRVVYRPCAGNTKPDKGLQRHGKASQGREAPNRRATLPNLRPTPIPIQSRLLIPAELHLHSFLKTGTRTPRMFNLLPKDTVFFDLFEGLAKYAVTSAQQLKELAL